MNNLENIHFSKMPNIGMPRSRIPLKQSIKGSCSFGKLVPLDAVPVVPGDDFAKVVVKGVIRMGQPIVPVMDDIECNLYAMFVPYRLLWANFENWFTTGNSNTLEGSPIDLNPSSANAQLPNWSICYNGVSVGSIAHYFGKPLYTADTSKAAYGIVNVMKEKAYYRIWSDWFIPRQLVTSTPNNATSSDLGTYVVGSTTTTVKPNSDLLPVCKSFDYFTAATLQPQYATGAVMVPIGSSAPVMTTENMHSMGTYALKLGRSTDADAGTGSPYNYTLKINQASTSAASGVVRDSGASGSISSPALLVKSNLYADLSQAAGATINSLREAFAVQKYCERSNYGNRFFEAIVAHFATTSPDARLQRSEYFGHARFLINVDQVVSTAGYDVGASQEVGAPGAISITGFKHSLGNKGFVEPGLVVILMSTRQVHHTYSQGVLREDSKLTKFEFYSPEFANLGDQATKLKELYLAGASTDNNTFGYQEHWGEDRYRPARVCGMLNPNAANSLDYWTMADKYATAPNLNANFIFENRDNIQRCLALGSTAPLQDFIYDIEIDYVADRPMPVYTIPGLIDHFGTR